MDEALERFVRCTTAISWGFSHTPHVLLYITWTDCRNPSCKSNREPVNEAVKKVKIWFWLSTDVAAEEKNPIVL